MVIGSNEYKPLGDCMKMVKYLPSEENDMIMELNKYINKYISKVFIWV